MERPSSKFNMPKQGLMPREEMLEVAKKQQKLTIGIPKENHEVESRVPLTPEAVELLTLNGHQVILEQEAGIAANYHNTHYSEMGGVFAENRAEVFKADLVLKITPPTLEEIDMMSERNTIVSSYTVSSHQSEAYIRKLMEKRVTAISFEGIQDEHNCYPVVRSMSGIAGTTSILIAAEYLSNLRGGKGVMLGGITGITPSEVVILGAGTAAEYAVRAALGLGAFVKVFDQSIHRLRRLQETVGQRIPTSIFHPQVIRKALKSADVLVGAVRLDRYHNGFYVTEDMVKEMKPGAVIVDISIDRGGCIETSEVRTQNDPAFTKHGVVHYCVPNIPSTVARTASIAISNVFTPMILNTGSIGGIEPHLRDDPGYRKGVYIYKGILTNQQIGDRFGLPSKDIELLMAAF